RSQEHAAAGQGERLVVRLIASRVGEAYREQQVDDVTACQPQGGTDPFGERQPRQGIDEGIERFAIEDHPNTGPRPHDEIDREGDKSGADRPQARPPGSRASRAFPLPGREATQAHERHEQEGDRRFITEEGATEEEAAESGRARAAATPVPYRRETIAVGSCTAPSA